MEHAPDLTHAGPGPESALSEAERRAAMEALVAQLPPKLRLPVQLCYLNGMTQRDVATALGVPLSTLHSRLKAALNRLRPLAERAGLRDTLGMLAAGALSGGLMMPPGGLTAGVEAGAGAAGAVVAIGGWSFLAWSTVAKVTAVTGAMVIVAAVTLTVQSAVTSEREPDQSVPRVEMASAVGPEELNEESPTEEPVADATESTVLEETEFADVPSSESIATARPSLELGAETEAELDNDEEGADTRFMTVLVTKKASGEPISGVSVGLWNYSVNPFQKLDQGVTDSEGTIRFDDVPMLRVGVGVGAVGWVSQRVTIDMADADPVVPFQLEPSGTLIVRVMDDKGDPVQHASVMIQNDPRGTIGGTNVNDSGILRWSSTVKGRPIYNVGVFHRDYDRVNLTEEITIPLELDEHTIEVVMKSGSESRSKEPLIGRVVDARNRTPISDAIVESRTGNPPLSTTTDDDGGFRFEYRERDAWTLESHFMVTAQGYAPKGFYVGQGKRDSITVELMRGMSTSGIVVDESGGVLPEVKVTATVEGGFVVAETFTDYRGAYQLEGLDLDTDLTFRADKRITRPGHDLIGKSTEVIVLEKAFPLSGKVVDAQTGEPLQQFISEIQPSRTRQPGDRQFHHRTWSYHGPTLIDSDSGHFSYGEYPRDFVLSLTITADGYQPTTIDRIVVDPDAEPVVVEMRR